MEIWKPIKNFEDIYEVSNLGRVRSLDRLVDYKPHGVSSPVIKKGSRLKLYYNKSTGYYQVNLWKNGIMTRGVVHRLVAETFIPNTEDKSCVNHKNGRKLDNRANNLEWATYKENNQHAYDTKLKTAKRMKVKCEELNKTFTCSNEAAIFIKNTCNITSELSTIRGNIRAVCKKKKGTAYKYHWKFII
jgi:hypothetical protein